MNDKTIMHMDADSLIYQIAYYNDSNDDQEALDDSEEDDGLGGLEKNNQTDWVKPIVEEKIAMLLKTTKCSDYLLHFTASGKNADIFEAHYGRKHKPQFTWDVAKALDKGYKENRVTPPPEAYKVILQAMVDNFNCVMHDEWEADHAVVGHKLDDPDGVMIVALDKDVLNQAPGVHWNYGKNCPVYTSEEDSVFYKYWQCIVGDPSDGYPGVKGIGQAGAKKFINNAMPEDQLWRGVLDAYASKGFNPELAVATMRLADMAQVSVKGDFKTGYEYELTLWEPPF